MDELRTKLEVAKIDVTTFKAVSSTSDRFLFSILVPQNESAATWRKCSVALSEFGWYPVIMRSEDDLLKITQLGASIAKITANAAVLGPESLDQGQSWKQCIAFSERLEALDWLNRRENKDKKYYTAELGDWQTIDRPKRDLDFSIGLSWTLKGPKHAEQLYIIFIPVEESWHVPAYLGFGGWNECPYPQEHVCMLKHWHSTNGASIATLTNDVIELSVSRPVSTKEEALRIAREHFTYCGDLVHQGNGTLAPVAASLLESYVWSFWWD